MSDLLERYRWFVVAVLAMPLLIAAGYLLSERTDDPGPLVIDTAELPPPDIKVYVAGAVQNPGVYPLAEDSRWIDALEAAGGPAADADLNAINLAQRIQDEDHIVVPRIGGGAVAVAGERVAPLVNINTAGQDELEALPGIGEVRAGRIIQSRTTDGAFAQIEDLLLRNLIPDSVYEEIAPLITVN